MWSEHGTFLRVGSFLIFLTDTKYLNIILILITLLVSLGILLCLDIYIYVSNCYTWLCTSSLLGYFYHLLT